MKRYIGVHAENKDESTEYQKALFENGYEWCNGGSKKILDHTHFYAERETQKIITCYHDPSIVDECDFLSIGEIQG